MSCITFIYGRSGRDSAFDLLRYQLPRLTAIFSHYVKAGWTCVDDEAAVTMTAEAWDDFVADCAMETPTFDAERLREVCSGTLQT